MNGYEVHPRHSKAKFGVHNSPRFVFNTGVEFDPMFICVWIYYQWQMKWGTQTRDRLTGRFCTVSFIRLSPF